MDFTASAHDGTCPNLIFPGYDKHRMSKYFSRIVAGIAASSLLLVTACSDDTTADGLAGELAAALSEKTLEDVPLTNPEAAADLDELVAPFADYDVDVTAGEIIYQDEHATLQLVWDWHIGEQGWQYNTNVPLTYEDSEWLATWERSLFIPNLGSSQAVGIEHVTPDRADILDRDGDSIVTERPVHRFGLDKTKVADDDVEEAAAAIARATGVEEEGFAGAAAAAGPKAFVEAITLRPEDVDDWVKGDFANLPGALKTDATMLLAPTSTFAREILGRAGPATAEIVEESDGEIDAGDVVGISGLQAHYDGQLRGQPDVEIFAVDSSVCDDPLECEQEDRHLLAEVAGEDPAPLELTLDVDTQTAAERALETLEGDEPPASALVAIQPSTGDILAAANGAGNDGFNAATVGQYPPGSTFKVVTALALLRTGVETGDTVACPDTTNVDGREFSNYDAYPENQLGDIPFTVAFAESCNTALIELREELSDDALAGAAASLGFGGERGLGFPAYLGQVPDPGGETSAAAALIGQGKILASPLAMATVAASVQGGATVTPRLVAEAGDGDDGEDREPLTPEEAAKLSELMRAVVTDGTGTVLEGVPGEEVIAKTGTAEHGDEDKDPHTWMIGAQGDLAVAVFVEAGVGGAETAGPVFKAFLEDVGF